MAEAGLGRTRLAGKQFDIQGWHPEHIQLLVLGRQTGAEHEQGHLRGVLRKRARRIIHAVPAQLGLLAMLEAAEGVPDVSGTNRRHHPHLQVMMTALCRSFKYGGSGVERVLLVGGGVANLGGFHQHDVLAATDNDDALLLALGALQPQGNLLCGLSLLLEDGLGLSSIA